MMTSEPSAWRAKDNDDDEYMIFDYRPIYFDIVEPLYTVGGFHQRVAMSQEKFDEWQQLYGENEDGEGTVFWALGRVIGNKLIYPNLYKTLVTSTKHQDNLLQSIFADLWLNYNPLRPEDSIDIVPDMKWFVRSKKSVYGVYEFLDGIATVNGHWYNSEKEDDPGSAIAFDTKEEAEQWVNPLTEVVQLPVR